MNARQWFTSTLAVGVLAGSMFAVGCGSEEQKPAASSSSTTAAKADGDKKTDAKSDAKSEKKDEKKDDKGGASADLAGLAAWKGKENPVKNDAAALKKGKEIFEKNCASCHGDGGKGDGAAGEGLNPKPRNFTADAFKYGSEDWALMRTIMEGAPGAGNGMVGWKDRMDEKEAWTVIHYVKSLKGKG